MALPQAGVDLGTAVKEYEEQLRRAASGSKGRRRRSKEAAAEAAGLKGVQIRPKRRLPVSKVGAKGGAGVRSNGVRLSGSASFVIVCLRSEWTWGRCGMGGLIAVSRISPCRCCWWAAPRACLLCAALCAT